jgi:hypothetical protein
MTGRLVVSLEAAERPRQSSPLTTAAEGYDEENSAEVVRLR